MASEPASRSSASEKGDVWVQLATRIPKDLHRQMKLHCVRTDASVMAFVVHALVEQLERETGKNHGPVRLPRRNTRG